MNLANNHALDYGAVGQADTVAAVREAGLLTTGRPGEIAYVKVRGTRVAVLGFAPYPWAQSLLDLPAAQALVRKADRWADLVVVTMHAGAEGADHQHVARERSGSWARTGATRSPSPTPSCGRAPTSSSAAARTCSAGWSGTAAG